MRRFFLALSVYVILPVQHGHTLPEALRCNPAISKNCACTIPALERSLGANNAALLISAWEVTHSPSAAERDNFFARHGKELVDLSISYARVKYVIASECRALAFDDEAE